MCTCTSSDLEREVTQEELPVELNVQVFLRVKCHLLYSITFFLSFLIRQVAVSWLSVAVTHTLKVWLGPSQSVQRRKKIITVADSSHFINLYTITGCLSFSLSHSDGLKSQRNWSHKCLFDYRCWNILCCMSLCFSLTFQVEKLAAQFIWSF